MCWWLLTLVYIVGMLDSKCAFFVTYHDISVAPVDVCWQSWHGFQCLDLLGCSAGFFCGCSKPMLMNVDGCWQLLTLLTCLIAHVHFFSHDDIAVALVDVCWSCWHDISYMQDISKAFFMNALVHLIPNSPVIMGDIAYIVLVYFGAYKDRSMNVLVHLIPKS